MRRISYFYVQKSFPSESHRHDLDNYHLPAFDVGSMATNTLIVIILILTLICLYFLAREWNRRDRQIDDLRKRVRDLEQANLQRLPHKSFEEILNAMVALDKEITERNFQTSLLENAKGHLTNAMAAGTKRENK